MELIAIFAVCAILGMRVAFGLVSMMHRPRTWAEGIAQASRERHAQTAWMR